MITYPPPVVELVRGIRVVRDDHIAGGTKARVVHALFTASSKEYVYASPCQGYAQIALAYAAAVASKRVTIFCAKRNVRHPRTVEAIAAGANVVEIGPAGYMSVVRRRAADYCQRTGATLLPFGLDTPIIAEGIAAVARTIEIVPSEVWTVAGSGTLSRALQTAWPEAVFNAVRIGAALHDVGRATVWNAPERFEDNAKQPPPFASCGNYDAKAWRFITTNATPGALFWNVAG